MFKGSIVALITPFRNGAVDERSFQSFIDWQIREGTHAVVPCGTTGESPTLSHAEHKRVVEGRGGGAGGRGGGGAPGRGAARPPGGPRRPGPWQTQPVRGGLVWGGDRAGSR